MFDLFEAKDPAKLLISVPHTGTEIPEIFLDYLRDDPQIRDCDLDYQVHELLDIPRLQEAGIHVLIAKIHRVCVDLNRSPELAVLNWTHNTHGDLLVTKPLEKTTRDHLQKMFYEPYLKTIRNLLESKNLSFIDWHSMPSKATDYHLKRNPLQSKLRPDFCLSDLNGRSLNRSRLTFIRNHLESGGHKVEINTPYQGGYITEFAMNFAPALQIEIKRALYMDESLSQLLPTAVKKLKSFMTELFIRYAQSWPCESDSNTSH